MHERLRTHAESVAFFGGGAREKEVIALFDIISDKFFWSSVCGFNVVKLYVNSPLTNLCLGENMESLMHELPLQI